jgi:uncharacterized protein (TIGR02117 family)
VRAHITAVLAGWLACCAVMPADAPVPDGEATIYVVGRGWHTDVGLPVSEVSRPLASLERDFPGVRFMVFGFGEREFYMAHNEGSGEMLAALLPSKSAILMTALNTVPTEAFSDHTVVALHLPPAGVERIVARLWDGLEKQADGSAERLANGPYPGSMFYAARETYDAFHTCNTWTALVLRDGGLPINTHVLFASQVMQQVSRIAALQAGGDLSAGWRRAIGADSR